MSGSFKRFGNVAVVVVWLHLLRGHTSVIDILETSIAAGKTLLQGSFMLSNI